jgi:GxxExxY protein
MKNREELEVIGKKIVNAVFQVHKELGPGLLESTYESCLHFELLESGLKVERQKMLPISYKGQIIDNGYRIDLLVEESIIVELKSVTSLMPVHEAQIISYLKLSGLKLGYLINFNVKIIKGNIHRKVNNL